MYLIQTNKSISDGEIIQGECILVDGSRIVDRGPAHSMDSSGAEVIDLRGLTVMPGFIDTHCHGAMGYDVMDASQESLDAISSYKMKEGTTSFCPTTITAPFDKIISAVKNVRSAMDINLSGAKVLGAFLEGPYINPEYKGAHPEGDIMQVEMSAIKKLLAAGDGCISSIIIAPELPGAIKAIETLTKMGIQVRLGHSSATIEKVKKAVDVGARVAVHTYNAMSPLHHRKPGMVGAILTLPELSGELICDLVHVHPAACQVLVNAKGTKGTILVTDSMMAAGLPDGTHKLGEMDVEVKNGISRLSNGTIAGSTASMSDCVGHMHRAVGIPLEDAVQSATATPARSLGVFDKIGSLDMGKSADIIAMDNDMQVCFVMIDGIIKIQKS